MDSVAHAADSSSASADISAVIDTIEWASSGVHKVCLKEGPSFFVREQYVPEPMLVALRSSRTGLNGQDVACLLLAGRAYLAERAAMDYLSRAEHSRYQLGIKLSKKEFTRPEYDPALDYLEARGFLDDARFAESWLRCRSIHRKEGRIMLMRLLRERGVGRHIADAALDAFFSVCAEEAVCVQAMQKAIRQGKTGKRLADSLLRKGFPARLVLDCIKKTEKIPEKVEILEFLEYSKPEVP